MNDLSPAVIYSIEFVQDSVIIVSVFAGVALIGFLVGVALVCLSKIHAEVWKRFTNNMINAKGLRATRKFFQEWEERGKIEDVPGGSFGKIYEYQYGPDQWYQGRVCGFNDGYVVLYIGSFETPESIRNTQYIAYEPSNLREGPNEW